MDDDELPLPDFANVPIEGLRDPTKPPVPPDPKKIEGLGGPQAAVGGHILPAMDAPPLELETDGSGETFAVFLLGFPHAAIDDVAGDVAKMFGLDVATASSLIMNAPISVKRGASRETASAIERGLRSLGAEVDIRPETNEGAGQKRDSHRAAASSAAKQAIDAQNAAAMQAAQLGLPAEAATPLAHGPPRALPSQGAPEGIALDGEHPGFWARIPMAFIVPFFGTGIVWLIALTMTLFLFAFIRLAPCIGIFMMPIAGAVYLGLLGIYFGQAAQAGLEDDGSRPKPRWHMPSQGELLARGGPLVVATILLFMIPVGLAVRNVPTPIVYATGLIPYVYWPMALTVSGITGSSMSLFNPVHIGRGIMAGGVPYAVVVVVGFMLFAGLSMLPALAAASRSMMAIMVSVVAMAGAVGYVAGVQGYLMGCIVGSRPEKFESLLE